MDEKIIRASTGNYGRINVVVPISAKESMMTWMKKSGFKKAQFFRTALMIGTVQLAQNLGIRKNQTTIISVLLNRSIRIDSGDLFASKW